MNLYRTIIIEALRFSWRYKFLWGVALFAALAGNGGELELVFSGNDSVSGQSAILGRLSSFYADGTLTTMIGNVRDYVTGNPLPTALFAILLIALVLLYVWLVTTGQASIIHAINALRNKQKSSFGKAFTNGSRFFLPIFILNLVAKAIIFGILLLVALPLGIAFVKTELTIYNTLYIVVAFLTLIPVTIILSFVLKYAASFVVIRGMTWKQGLRNSIALFKKNWLLSLEMAALLFLINLTLSLIVVYLLSLLGLPTNPAGLLVFYVILTVFGTFIATFQYSAWVFLFFELEKGTARSKILRVSDDWTGLQKPVIGK